MSTLLQLTLGILTAMGGFIDIGELVFNVKAGSIFGYHLLWAIPIGVVIITIFAEMSGRIAAVTKKPVTLVMRERLGFTLGSCAIVSSIIVNIITCSAELGGIAIILHLLTGFSYQLLIPVSVFLFAIIMWVSTFKLLERTFGFLGLFMLIFIATIIFLHPSWQSVFSNLIPHLPQNLKQQDLLLYFYYAVGIIAATIMPYEAYFYSSGGIEEKWEPKDIKVNIITSIFGFTLGSLLSVALIIIGAKLFMRQGIDPQLLGTAALGPMVIFGKWGTIAALIGMFFAIGGAALETALSTAYNSTQFLRLKWGEQKRPQEVPQFTISWLIVFVIALIVLLFGADPINLTEYAVIFSVVVLPLTYLPILLTANDKKLMKKYVNPTWLNIFAWLLFVIIIIIALSAVPLMLLTHGGE